MIIYFISETRDDGKTFKLHTGIGYWTDESKAKAKAEQLNRVETGELTRFEVFTMHPYEDTENDKFTPEQCEFENQVYRNFEDSKGGYWY